MVIFKERFPESYLIFQKKDQKKIEELNEYIKRVEHNFEGWKTDFAPTTVTEFLQQVKGLREELDDNKVLTRKFSGEAVASDNQ